MTITTQELSPNIGVEIRGMRGHDLVDPEVARACLQSLDRHGVVVYREAHIEDADLVAFSRMLGDVVVPKVNDPGEYPEVAQITMDPTQSVLASVRAGNFLWHIDGTHDEQPQKGTLLVAREVDPAGGDTEFATTYAAYEALPADEKATIENLNVVHRFSAALKVAYPDASPEVRTSWDRVRERVHPLVWRRQDGRRSLLIGSTADEIVGWSKEDSDALLAHLVAWATQPQFTYRHHWSVGDLVVWDNTGMLHRALHFEPTSRRLLHRTTLVGQEPVSAH